MEQQNGQSNPVVFTPDNEPYLGRKMLFHFDEMIVCVLEQNSITAPTSHGRHLSDHQHAACLLISQSLNIMLSIRELIRQGYLFGGHVLLRAFIERTVILQYLYLFPEEIECWNQGWEHNKAPSLAKMFDAIQVKGKRNSIVAGKDMTAPMNSLLHGKPDSAKWNLILLSDHQVGLASSKILNRPDLCDELCADVVPWIVVLQAMIATYFPKEPTA